jgi:hypothetical protein
MTLSSCADQLHQRGFIVGHPRREQSPPVGVDHHAIAINNPADDRPSRPYTAITSHLSVRGRVVARQWAANPPRP